MDSSESSSSPTLSDKGVVTYSFSVILPEKGDIQGRSRIFVCPMGNRRILNIRQIDALRDGNAQSFASEDFIISLANDGKHRSVSEKLMSSAFPGLESSAVFSNEPTYGYDPKYVKQYYDGQSGSVISDPFEDVCSNRFFFVRIMGLESPTDENRAVNFEISFSMEDGEDEVGEDDYIRVYVDSRTTSLDEVLLDIASHIPTTAQIMGRQSSYGPRYVREEIRLK
ncbi:hypothetical protein ADUPG1_014139 [Aduncisulcus paluster]|uniref:Uncharacterized protein n=1 Tax=Aduncisulcus paluster TaxID=2918883 RepID=A0ABQ5KAW8_9EUKA|nr:hypothetical protein ADUPG1_014139 [Aduncisulcus paluster]